MVLIWVAMSFWGLVFLVAGFLSLFENAWQSLLLTAVGVFIMVTVYIYINRLRKEGLSKMVIRFYSDNFLELFTTSILAIFIAIIVSEENLFLPLINILLLPMSFGLAVSFRLAGLMVFDLTLSFIPVVIIILAWLFQIFWLYVAASAIVWIIKKFNLRNPFD